jgi:hypothetical protein
MFCPYCGESPEDCTCDKVEQQAQGAEAELGLALEPPDKEGENAFFTTAF